MDDHRDALVVGGGVIGLTASWRLAQSGRKVTVVDPAPGRGASWVAAGMLAAAAEAEHGDERLGRLLVSATRLWPQFAGELEAASGRDIGYLEHGTVMVAADRSDLAVVEDLVALQSRLGLPAERLSARACRELLPALAPGICGGAWMPLDHQVDNRRLVDALLCACQDAGVELRQARALVLDLDAGGSARGVTLDSGDHVGSTAVLLAMGAWTGQLAGVPAGALPPIRPVKGHVLRLRHLGAQRLLDRTVRGVVRGRTCYLVPRQDGTVVLGATVEEQGYDLTIRAGAVHQLLHDARTLVPDVDELVIEEQLAGLRPGAPANVPTVGWTDVPGLAVATGHYRNGILLAPLAAQEVLATLLDDRTGPAGTPGATAAEHPVGGGP